MRCDSVPGFHRKVSKCTERCAARMRGSSTSKKAPFSSTSTLLPSTEVPSVSPEMEGISLSKLDSDCTRRIGLRWRRIDQMTITSTTISASDSQSQRCDCMDAGLLAGKTAGSPLPGKAEVRRWLGTAQAFSGKRRRSRPCG